MALKFIFMTIFLILAQYFLCFQASSSPVLAPITQDLSTRQFLLSLHLKSPPQHINLLLDLGASLSWVDYCTANETTSSVSHPIPCASPLCNSLASSVSCSSNSCHILLSSPRHRKGLMVQALVDNLALPATNGRNPGQLRLIPEFVLTCSGRSSLKGQIPKGMPGLAALGRSNFSLAAQVSAAAALPKVFALCLSGSPSAPGVAFFGTAGPYNFLPETDLSKYLNYTPLLSSHDNYTDKPSSEYFIGLTSIKVNGKPLVNGTRIGMGKLSLGAPYTILESSIYAVLSQTFVNESAVLLKRTVTEPVAPFSGCYSAADVWETNTGPVVPIVDFVMNGGDKLWRIFGSNSMVRISRTAEGEGVDVWCLAFVDGGVSPPWPVVIGGHQMVDNLLQFDLESDRLGFSSSVLVHNTMCANFNFTVNSTLA